MRVCEKNNKNPATVLLSTISIISNIVIRLNLTQKLMDKILDNDFLWWRVFGIPNNWDSIRIDRENRDRDTWHDNHENMKTIYK